MKPQSDTLFFYFKMFILSPSLSARIEKLPLTKQIAGKMGKEEY